MRTQLEYLRELDLAEVATLDGERIGEAFRQALKRMASDIDDRPGDDRPRKVSLEMALVPEIDESGNCDNVKMQIQVKESIPTRKSRVYDLGIKRTAAGKCLTFSPDSPDNHNQPGLGLMDE